MSSSAYTITFYVAPSKERHPLVSQLLSFLKEEVYQGPCKVKVRRIDGFLRGDFHTYDGDFFEGEFERLYEELGALGCISEDRRGSWWSSNGDGGSDWYDRVGCTYYEIGTNKIHCWDDDYGYDSRPRSERKEKVRKFWEQFPNLMHILKYDRPPE